MLEYIQIYGIIDIHICIHICTSWCSTATQDHHWRGDILCLHRQRWYRFPVVGHKHDDAEVRPGSKVLMMGP